ncbi:Calcium-transporting ATPase sarcoplasmic/endoplasmic reticulum type [Symbiodinium microadriaticum]|uniref:Calcium-transporting ATPase sarcoplasmic/endoplasmic reticulum type n=1 Tax=Symbiodinium microadriaticum TaxID=2951 RepID=A0A1Q9F765_SYMMI|nr:Calcium-transporting ATPase sarcoplasmic/endoplasmic reticulum type [Symbiodinium microadriaticum]
MARIRGRRGAPLGVLLALGAFLASQRASLSFVHAPRRLGTAQSAGSAVLDTATALQLPSGAHAATEQAVLEFFNVTLDRGLSEEQVAEQRSVFGWNQLAEQAKKTLWQLVLEQFDDLLVRILLLSAFVSFLLAYFNSEQKEEGLSAYVEPLVILLILAINACVGVWQESNAEKALDSLKKSSNGAWHIGGFCFGQGTEESSKAAEIRAHVTWEGQRGLNEMGPVKLVAFDATEQRWGTVKDTWGKEACEDKIDSANMVRLLNKTKVKFNFRIKASAAVLRPPAWGKMVEPPRTSAPRDWHFALLTCGEVERAPLVLTLEATKGAMNMFAANSNFDSSSCPVTNASWFVAASDDAGFWMLIVGALLLGACSVLCVLVCRQFRAKGKEEASSLQLPPPAVSGAEPVIGRPCTAVGEELLRREKIVDGQIRANPQLSEAATANSSEMASPESDV